MKQEYKIDPFCWEMYIIICMSYLFGFIAGWTKAWFLIFSLLILIYPFYLRHKRKNIDKKINKLN